MTTTVVVKARAHGALVTVTEKSEGDEGHVVSSQEVEVEPNTDRSFHIHQHQAISVIEGKPPVPTTEEEAEVQHGENPRPFIGEPVPGAAENDALLGKQDDSGSTFQQ